VMVYPRPILQPLAGLVTRYGRGHSKPILPPTPQVLSSARGCTRIGPLSVFTNVAVIKTANHSSNSNY
jgi:hypothetical protein